MSLFASAPSHSLEPDDTAILGGGLFNPSFVDRDRNYINLGVSGPLASLQQNMLSQAGGLFAGLEGDPMAVARSQYNLLAPILNEQFEKDRLALESRLFSQGRLFSTPGTDMYGQLLATQDDTRNKVLFDALNQGLNARTANFNIGQGLFSNALGIDQAAMDLFTKGLSIYGGAAPQPSPGLGDYIVGGLVNAGLSAATGGLSNAIMGPMASSSTFMPVGTY